MSTFDIGGLNLKEWAFIILMINLTLVTAMVVVSFVLAIQQGQTIPIKGGFDLSQFTAIVMGVATVATVLVAQQLTAKQNQALIEASKKKD